MLRVQEKKKRLYPERTFKNGEKSVEDAYTKQFCHFHKFVIQTISSI